MIRIIASIVWLVVQAAPPQVDLPPAYPRPGATKILDNDRVQVWDIAWLRGQPSPLHRHIYDLVGVYYEPGDRIVVSPEGVKRPVATKAWDIAFQRSGVTHIEEGVSDSPLRAIFVEIKQSGLYAAHNAPSGARVFAGEGATQKLDNDRVIVWEYTRPSDTQRHLHVRDGVVVAFRGGKPSVTWIGGGALHENESTGDASRVYVFEIK